MPRIDQIYEDTKIDNIDKVPEKYREIVRKILEENNVQKNNITEIISGEMGEDITALEEVSNFFSSKDEVILGHGTNGTEKILNSIFSDGLIVKDSENVRGHISTLSGLDSTSLVLGPGSDNFYAENEEMLDNWKHKDAKDIIIVALPLKYMYGGCSIGNDNYEHFYVEDDKRGGFLLRPEFIKGRYNARNKSFTPNKNYYKNLDASKQEELFEEIKNKFTESVIRNFSESIEELRASFCLDDKEFDELVVNWYVEKLKASINKEEIKEDKEEYVENYIENDVEIDDFDWDDKWEEEFYDITEKLGDETKEEQSYVLEIEEIENMEKQEIQKQRGNPNDIEF